jgi:ATP-binding cassette, subfamily B, bacterial
MHLLIRVEEKGKRDLSQKAFVSLMERDYEFYSNNFVGSLTKKALSFASRFEQFSDVLTFNVVTNVFPILFAIVMLWQYSFWLPLILIVSVATVITIAIPIIRRRSALVAARHAAGSKVSGNLSDTLTNVLAIKAFATEAIEEREQGKDVDAYVAHFKKAADYQNLRLDTALSPLYVAANVAGLIAAIVLTERLALPVGTMVIIFSYYALVTRVFWEINHIYRNIENALTEAAEFTELLRSPPKIADIPRAKELVVTSAEIEFRRASFGYVENAGTRPFFENFNLKIRPGERVGLVGPSGGGKTTITKLLMRFVDLHSGEILIDGQSIAEVTQASLRQKIGYVPQEPLLFHRSLFANIAYGDEKASKEEVIRAAKLAHADEFINTLPEGYDTLVGERGVKLSGGQRQRIAIARTMLKDAPILILDEATSALDSESEKYIQEGLWELMKDKTAIVIAHRLSTIKHLDRIIVLENGKIVQDGSHDDLVAQPGLYQTLWSHQSGGFIED